jgi:GT2 family glycosyltransferase
MKLSDCLVVIPTFYPGEKILYCLNSIPEECDILIVDNGDDIELLKNIDKSKKKITHYKVGDAGLPKSFNYALKNCNKKYLLVTQPDVVFENNCIQNLLLSYERYPNAGIVCPLIFENKTYSKYDYMELGFDKKNNKLLEKKIYKNLSPKPFGDFCVEAVNATAMLLKKEFLDKIGGWDENIYTYCEDIDLCLRLRIVGHEIIKIKDSKVNHVGFQSHKRENFNDMNLSRNWHFCWSSIYFKKKHSKKYDFYKYFFFIFLKYFIKTLVYFCFFRIGKFKQYSIRLRACLNFIFIGKSNFRPDVKK